MVTSAAVHLGDQDKAKSLTSKLTDSMQRWAFLFMFAQQQNHSILKRLFILNSCSYKAFQDEVIKRSQSNSNALVKANLGCIEQFRWGSDPM